MAKTPKARKSPETKPRKQPADDPAQYKRFREFAREHDANESKEKFDAAFERIVGKARSPDVQ
jgi:hypothetical protein